MPDREKVIAWLADEELYYREHGDTHNSLMACNALALLKEQDNCENCAIAIEDRQPVVRCKDCKYYHKTECASDWCIDAEHDDWFCADGKRKDE